MKDNDNSNNLQEKTKSFFENYFVKIDKILEKIANFFKKDKFAGYLLKLTSLFIITAFILTIIYIILKPNIDSYQQRIDKSYIKEIFSSEEINPQDIIIKKLSPNNDNSKQPVVYSVFDTKGKIGYASKEKVHGYIPDTPYNKDHEPIKEKMTIMVGIYIDGTLCGIRVIDHEETLRLTAPIDDIEYLNHFSSDDIRGGNRAKLISESILPQDVGDFKNVFGVDAITGASQTSMGLINAIKEAYNTIGNYDNFE
jgi:Na+-translocating ferredoxin:NAD+ oxidoreductase RnfG subunit